LKVSKPGFETQTFKVTVDTEGASASSFLGLEVDVATRKKLCSEMRVLFPKSERRAATRTRSWKRRKLLRHQAL